MQKRSTFKLLQFAIFLPLIAFIICKVAPVQAAHVDEFASREDSSLIYSILNRCLGPVGLYRQKLPAYWVDNPTFDKAFTKMIKGGMGMFVYTGFGVKACSILSLSNDSFSDLLNPCNLPYHLLLSYTCSEFSLAYAEFSSGGLDMARILSSNVKQSIFSWFFKA